MHSCDMIWLRDSVVWFSVSDDRLSSGLLLESDALGGDDGGGRRCMLSPFGRGWFDHNSHHLCLRVQTRVPRRLDVCLRKYDVSID